MSIQHPRILLYSHDTYGLGHLRRTLAIAGQLARDLPNANQLLLTGSMVAGAFGLPPNLDLIKLPALSKRSSGEYKPRALRLSSPQTIAWREQMILQAAQAFKPDLVLVDKTAPGVQGELLPTLRHLKTWKPETHLVLGMRDIEDDPDTTKTPGGNSGSGGAGATPKPTRAPTLTRTPDEDSSGDDGDNSGSGGDGDDHSGPGGDDDDHSGSGGGGGDDD